MVQCHKQHTSGSHFLKGDDATYVLVCIHEVDTVTYHAIAIWRGDIYNLYQEYVWEQSHGAFYAICELQELYQQKFMAKQVLFKRKKIN
jgi:hypothetical protein